MKLFSRGIMWLLVIQIHTAPCSACLPSVLKPPPCIASLPPQQINDPLTINGSGLSNALKVSMASKADDVDTFWILLGDWLCCFPTVNPSSSQDCVRPSTLQGRWISGISERARSLCSSKHLHKLLLSFTDIDWVVLRDWTWSVWYLLKIFPKFVATWGSYRSTCLPLATFFLAQTFICRSTDPIYMHA